MGLLCLFSPLMTAFAMPTLVSATSGTQGLSEEQLNMFAQNDILFYDPGECVGSGGSSTVCGDTAKEMYWSALSKYIDDPIKVAGVMGNLAAEGNFQPALWEYSITNSDGTLTYSWESIYGGDLDGKKGVGAFGITSGLSTYLHAVNDDNPDMLKYFKDSVKYSIGSTHPGVGIDKEHPTWGDVLLEKIGKDEFGKLVEFEVKYAMEDFNPSRTKEYLDQKFSNPSDAAYWWMDQWERPGYRNPDDRKKAAEKAYDDFKNFQCSSSSSSSSKSSGSKNTCAKLGELRTAMWDKASQADKESFMKTVSEEDHSIAGVEGYMNQIISKHGSNGTLHDWLTGQCEKYRPASASCTGSHKITKEEQGWIDDALEGSNNIKFAIGNATGGSSVGAGKIVCVWDGSKCRDDVDYTKEDGKGKCNVYSPSANFGECWGLEGEDKWAENMEKSCGSSSCSGSGKFVWYAQFLEPWASVKYTVDGVTSTIGEDGCGPTAFAMLANMLLSKEVTPKDTIKVAADTHSIIPGAGSIGSVLTKNLAEHYGLEWKKLDNSSRDASMKDITKHLKEGWMVMTAGAGSTPYTSGGHYVGIREITNDGKWLLADSGHSEDVSKKSWDPKDVMSAGMNPDNVYAIRGSSNSADCDNICPDDDKSTNTNGFSSAKDAQFIIDAYKKDDLSKYSLSMPPSGDYHDNCVAFSLWFINHFTKISYPGGLTGNGNQFVDRFYSRFKSKYPDLKITDTPSVYSVASWSVAVPAASSGNHTGIVIGIDEDNDKILIAEAGWDQPSFTGIHEYQLSPFKGSGKKYINLNKYLKSNTGLK